MSIPKQRLSVTHRIPDSAIQRRRSAEKVLAKNPAVIALIAKIKGAVKQPDDQMIAIAKDVAELRRIVETEGLNGGVSWFEWAPRKLKGLGDRSKLYQLHRLAEAGENAPAELARQRRLGCERSKAFRAREAERKSPRGDRKAPLEEERRQIINWTMNAALSQVRELLKQIPKMGEHPN